jgi:hypothetical protein
MFVLPDDVAALTELPDTVLSERVVELVGEVERLQARLLEAVAVWDGRRAWAADGAVDPRAWLTHHTPLTRRDANQLVRTARHLRRHDLTRTALADGDVPVPHVTMLAQAASHGRDELYEEHEKELLELAASVTARDFPLVAKRWRALADDTLTTRDAESVHRRRFLHVSSTFGGAVAVNGFLDPESGAILQAGLDAFETFDPPNSPLPRRSAEQRRVDSLVDLVRTALSPRDEARPGATAHIDITVGADRRELDGSGPITNDTFERLLCDSRVQRVLTDSEHVRVDLGRASRTVTPAQRRALKHRDGGCGFPGCDRPPHWCDAHHLRPWDAGGRTDLDNLVLLCRRHHMLVHEHGWSLTRDPSTGAVDARPPP